MLRAEEVVTYVARAGPAFYYTLTWAQTLDGKIGKYGVQVPISGPESLVMTHLLRQHHDGIIVGAGTLNNDDPSLTGKASEGPVNTETTARLPVPRESPPVGIEEQPQPIILDRNFSVFRPSLAVMERASSQVGHPPWWVCDKAQKSAIEATEGYRELLQAGGRIIYTAASTGTPAYWDELGQLLQACGLRNVMVEGGAHVINSLLSCVPKVSLPCNIVITVAPRFANASYIGVTGAELQLADPIHAALGDDVVIGGRVLPEPQNKLL